MKQKFERLKSNSKWSRTRPKVRNERRRLWFWCVTVQLEGLTRLGRPRGFLTLNVRMYLALLILPVRWFELHHRNTQKHKCWRFCIAWKFENEFDRENKLLDLSSKHHNKCKLALKLMSGWPRHRENRKFGSYFFQTGKTQGILFWQREKFPNTGKIFGLWLSTQKVCLFFKFQKILALLCSA